MSADNRPSNPLMQVLIDLTSGAIGGVACVLSGQPFDTAKVKMQTFPSMYRNFLECAVRTYRVEGFRGLYHGTMPALAANISENAVLFACYGFCQSLVSYSLGLHDPSQLRDYHKATAGSMASVFSSLVLCPTELVKCRMQTQHEMRLSGHKGVPHKSTAWSIVSDILKSEGVAGLFRGLSSTWLREVPGYFFFFGGYELSSSILNRNSGEQPGPLVVTISGGVGGACFWISVYPVDSVKSRIQVLSMLSHQEGFLVSLIHILRTEEVLCSDILCCLACVKDPESCRGLTYSSADWRHPGIMSCQALDPAQQDAAEGVICYNKGCGERFLPSKNSSDSCLYHPGYPIFHDALKGWSCCRKRTTDFSEFLAIKGCTKGPHSNEKPSEPLKPDISGSKNVSDGSKPSTEIIMTGPKSAEKMQKERPSGVEELRPLLLKVSRSLEQELEKLALSAKQEETKTDEAIAALGTKCKHSGCKEIYQGPESEVTSCMYHPGVPVFHEGMKYWSCCCIRTSDFNAFLDQKGCSTGKHLWVQPRGKKEVSCRYDWHQTSSLVVITIYAKASIPDLTKVQANRTQLDIEVTFQEKNEFRRKLELWGVIDMENSYVNLLPTKVEITLKKSDPVTWARLELTASQPHTTTDAEPELIPQEGNEAAAEESDDSLSWSEDEELE